MGGVVNSYRRKRTRAIISALVAVGSMLFSLYSGEGFIPHWLQIAFSVLAILSAGFALWLALSLLKDKDKDKR